MSVHPTPESSRHGRAALPSADHPLGTLTPIQHNVLVTIAYADMFDYPLTLPEIQRYLVGAAAQLAEVTATVDGLTGRGIEQRDGFVFPTGRQHTVDTRLRRRASSALRWNTARRYATSLSRWPFVRMVAVCGSLAMHNVDDEGDIDIFCITAAGRLWWGQVAAMLLRRLPTFARQRVCPNFFLSTGSLPLDDRNLYTAHEIVQAVPLFGESVFREFVAANAWLDGFLPNARGVDTHLCTEARGSTEATHAANDAAAGATTLVERLFAGRLGDALDRLGYATLLRYYSLRLRRRGVTFRQLRRYYRRDRQLVVGGGYEVVVRSRFIEHLRTFLDAPGAAAVAARLLPPNEAATADGRDDRVSPPLYEQQFETRYGADR